MNVDELDNGTRPTWYIEVEIEEPARVLLRVSTPGDEVRLLDELRARRRTLLAEIEAELDRTIDKFAARAGYWSRAQIEGRRRAA